MTIDLRQGDMICGSVRPERNDITCPMARGHDGDHSYIKFTNDCITQHLWTDEIDELAQWRGQ